MNYIGNVLFEGDGYMPPVSPFLKLFTSIKDIKNRLPTLIVGKESASRHIKGFSVLKKDYPKQNKWWTFARTERGVDFIDDMESFITMLVERITHTVEYCYINVITAKYSEIRAFYSVLSSMSMKYYYNDRNRFLFVYNEDNNTIYGISLSTCEYVGLDKEKVKERIERANNAVRVDSFYKIPSEIRSKYTLIHQLIALWPHF